MLRLTSYTKGVLTTLLGVLIITPDSLLIRLIDDDSFSINFWRGLFVFFAILGYLVWTSKTSLWSQLKRLNRYDYYGLTFFVSGSMLFVYSINNSAVSTTLVILSTAPFFAAIFSYLFLREAISSRILGGIVCCFIGILVIVSESWFEVSEDSLQMFSWKAFFGALFCSVSFAANFSLSRGGKQTNITLSFGLSGAVVALLSLSFTLEIGISTAVWHWMLIDGLIIIPLSYMLMLIGAKSIPAPQSTMMLQLETFLGPLWVWLVLDEYPGIYTIIGGAIIFSALIVVNFLQLKHAQ